MNPRQSTCRAGAFTLVELLCVLAIIAILAALILPTLNQSKDRVKRVECENNLRQLGIAFHAFMHEHSDQFPMAVSQSAGGSQEFVQSGYGVDGEFYFSYRHFQTLAYELSSPAILVCPADTRLPATDFGALQNSNVSYFVGVKAEYAKPNSVLAGDRNLTANAVPNPSLLHSDTDNRLWWTRELHRFKGNVLFADGRVEEWGNAALAAAAGGQLAGADLFLPSVPATANPSTVSFREQNPAPTAIAGSSVTAATRLTSTNRFSADAAATVTTVPAETEPGMSAFDQRLARQLRRLIIGTYLLVLLLFGLRLVYLAWRRWQREAEQRENES